MPPQKLVDGQIIQSNCSVCKRVTDHRYQPGELIPLICIDPDHASRLEEKKNEKKEPVVPVLKKRGRPKKKK